MSDYPSFKTDRIFGIISALTVLVLCFMIFLPLSEALGRHILFFSIPGSVNWVQHMVLWLGLLGGILATLQGQHLSISTSKVFRKNRFFSISGMLSNLGTVIFLLFLTLASVILVKFQMSSPEKLGGWLPVWAALAVMPICVLLMTIATINTGWEKRRHRLLIMFIAILFCLVFIYLPFHVQSALTTPLMLIILVMAFLGMPLYAVLGGLSLVLFLTAEMPIAALPSEAYRIMTQPVLPSIPLFALSGTILAAGGAPKRLIQLITAWTSWIRGGAAIATVIGCALFTAITGASGVTILALGGLLLPLLIASKFEERFSIGLLTSSGSVGLLLPPSLPVILYGIYGHVAINRLFMAALFPGILLIILLSLMSLYMGKTGQKKKSAFNFHQALIALRSAAGDLMIPVIIIAGLFGGILTLIETAALTVLWAVLLETVFHRKLSFRKGLPKAMVEAAVLMGALLMVLGLASGLVSYIIDAQIPFRLTDWVVNVIHSKIIFLLALNLLLLVVGAFMDIFSAIVIVVPIIVPIGLAFQIDPVHLGVIFLANLELGYLTPPIGINLFLSSLRFKRPLIEIWRTVIPFLIIFVIWVLLITYVPAISVGLAGLL